MVGTITWLALRRVPSLFSSEGGRLLRVGDVEEPITATLTRASSLRFWYGATIPEFLGSQTDAVVGQLAVNCDFALLPTQRDAWLAQIEFLRSQLIGLSGSIFFEFNIPRMGRRIDVVLVIGAVVFAIEFKVGEKVFDRSAIDQVWDYGLDLKNFHEASHDASIVPILIATEARECPPLDLHGDADKLYRPIIVNPVSFRGALELALRAISGAALDPQIWSRASYHPTPTIVEAARSLYAQHSVEAIARFDAASRLPKNAYCDADVTPCPISVRSVPAPPYQH